MSCLYYIKQDARNIEKPLIYLLYKCQQTFLNKLVSKLVKPDIYAIQPICTLKEVDTSFSELDVSIKNQKEDDNLFIGFTTRNKLNDYINPGEEERKIYSF